jgi:hypothetical protein
MFRKSSQPFSPGDVVAGLQVAEWMGAAADYLTRQGVASQRLRTETGPSAVAGGEAQAVSFAVGQRPY